MAKVKTALTGPALDQRLVDERGPTLERIKQASWDHIEVGDSGVITVRQSPIERAVRRGTFTERQGQAAEKFYQHWFRAGLAGSMGSADPLKVFSTSMDFSRLCKTEMAEFNWFRVKEAMATIAEKMDNAGFRADHAQRLMWLIVCQEVPFAEAGQAIGFNGDSSDVMARTYMRANLNILIAAWGL